MSSYFGTSQKHIGTIKKMNNTKNEKNTTLSEHFRNPIEKQNTTPSGSFPKSNRKNTTMSEHFRNPIEKSQREAKSIPLTLKYIYKLITIILSYYSNF